MPWYDGDTCANRGLKFTQSYTLDLQRKFRHPGSIPVYSEVPVLTYLADDHKDLIKLPDDKPIAITVSGGKPDLTVKHWSSDKHSSPYIQEVIDATSDRYTWVQIGSHNPAEWHPDLNGVIDLRGKTAKPEDFLRLLLQAKRSKGLVLCGVTLLAWMAATVSLNQSEGSLALFSIVGGREQGSENLHFLPDGANLFYYGSSLECAGRYGCWESKTEANISIYKNWNALNRHLCKQPVTNRGVRTPACMAAIPPSQIIADINRYGSRKVGLCTI